MPLPQLRRHRSGARAVVATDPALPADPANSGWPEDLTCWWESNQDEEKRSQERKKKAEENCDA